MQTTDAINGCNVVLELDNTSGVLTDFSGSSNSVELSFDREIGEFKSFASLWKGRIPCGKDATIKIKVIMSQNTGELSYNLLDWWENQPSARKTFRATMPDGSSGSDRFTGEVVLKSMPIVAAADDADPIMIDAELMPDGAITWSQV